MRILIATPLYPPDTAPAARYAKELAERLSKIHEVTVLTYGHLPEELNGVTTLATPKDTPLWNRLLTYTTTLRRLATQVDVVLLLNGPSTELPALFISTKTLFHIADLPAHEYAKTNFFRNWIETQIRKKSTLLTTTPLTRPEILPFEPYPTDAFTEYETSWDTHLTELNTYV